jgi:hypothetical protein
MNFEEVRLENIGRGGTNDDTPLVEMVDHMLQRAAAAVVSDEVKAGSTATITIKLVVKAQEGAGVAVLPDVDIKWPKPRLLGITGFVSDGRLLTAEHKQTALDLGAPKVIDLPRKEGQK